MPFFSVIIPVYNVQAYLASCVQSIQQQDFTDVEILLVNDGSTDRSPQLCDELAQNNPGIRVIHKPNGGASEARNVGVAQATGKYVLFMDSDDFWEGTTGLSHVHAKIQSTQADVVLYGAQDYFEATQTKVLTRGNYPLWSFQYSLAERFNSLIQTHNFPGAAWIMAIRRELLLDHGIAFQVGIKAEDIDWIVHVFSKIKSLETVHTPFYVYRKNRPGSVTSTADYKNVVGILYALERWQTPLENSNQPEKYSLLSYLASQYFTAFVSFVMLDSSQKKELTPRMKKVQSIAQYDRSLRGKVARVCLKVLGVNGFANLVYRIYSWNSSK
ncbi:MAG: glycosyltransferase family 2 protein [Flavobacterium sp.]|uniref:glycosyltransferase family 2 protein n=1 Tax=Flavobacterium sp. TaxID=239 RepID=UPI0022BA9294|nr:glycosyltransferase family 2 protein [Flavobacterium sp.]MCZ8298017.1 glycosyltransferase family 2 protein [Flavobacterium sp.]